MAHFMSYRSTLMYSPPMLTLYTTLLSANGRKALAVCRYLGVTTEVKTMNVYAGEGRSPAYLAINPLGKIPTLVDGDLTLWESNAILQYVSEAYADCRLWSREPKRRADIARWLFWEAAHWQPTLTALPGLAGVVAFLLRLPGASANGVVSWNDPSFVPLAALLETQLASRTFVAGDELTLADFSVAAMMTYARAGNFPFSAYPGIAAWYARIEALEAWRATATPPWA
jgi:glutathione S-transferase